MPPTEQRTKTLKERLEYNPIILLIKEKLKALNDRMGNYIKGDILVGETKLRTKLKKQRPLIYTIYKHIHPEFSNKDPEDYYVELPSYLQMFYRKKLTKKLNFLMAKVFLNYVKSQQTLDLALLELSRSKAFGLLIRHQFYNIIDEMSMTGHPVYTIMENLNNSIPNLFDKNLILALEIGYTTASIEQNLNRYILEADFQLGITRKLKSALLYPVLLIIILLVMCVGIKLYFYPVILDLVGDNTSKIPNGVNIACSIADVLLQPLKLLKWVIVGFVVKTAFKHVTYLKILSSRLLLRLPVLGEFVTTQNTCFFFRSLYFQMNANIATSIAHEESCKTLSNIAIKTIFEASTDDITTGSSLSSLYSDYTFIDETTKILLKSSEESGNLTETVRLISEAQTAHLENSINNLLGVIPTVSLILVGGFIVAVIVPLYTNMGSMISVNN